MKLELKHLAAYLPYKLNVLSGDSKEVYELTSLENGHNFIRYERSIQLYGEKAPRYYIQPIRYCKPILRHLSDIYTFKYKPKYAKGMYTIAEIMPAGGLNLEPRKTTRS